jgi:hypothetical protein
MFHIESVYYYFSSLTDRKVMKNYIHNSYAEKLFCEKYMCKYRIPF